MRSLAVLACLGWCACYDAPVERPTTTTTEVSNVSFLTGAKDQVDLLFVIDKSNSMEKKQTELKRRFPDLIRQLEGFAATGKKAHYHVGVITTDMGAPGVKDCLDRGGKLVGGGLDTNACPALGGGVAFLDYNQKTGESNLPAGRTLEQTFQCMASVGINGCGFEMQLEAAYRALSGAPAENQGFLRPNALLAVVWVTDEDDCSAPPDTDLFANTNLLQPAGLGALHSFRCAQYGIKCGSPLEVLPNAVASYAECAPMPAGEGKLYDVQRYIDFFTLPRGKGGIKDDPEEDVILLGIAGDADQGLKTLLAVPNTTPYQPCTSWDGRSCTWVVDNACTSRLDPSWVGDPAVRLAKVVGAAAKRQLTSVCEASYQGALERLGELIRNGIKRGCMKSPIANPADPQCVVEDITPRDDGGPDDVAQIFSCTSRNDAPPCWRVTRAEECPALFNPVSMMDEKFSIEIERGGLPVSSNTAARVQCATIAARR